MSIDPSKPITNQVNPTYQANNHGGGGYGGGSASSYKGKEEEPKVDSFSAVDEFEKEISGELINKSMYTLFIEFLKSIYDGILSFFGIKKEDDASIEDNKRK